MQCKNCPFKKDAFYQFYDESIANYGRYPYSIDKNHKYKQCLLMSIGTRPCEKDLFDKCIGENKCPIFQKGDITKLLLKKLES